MDVPTFKYHPDPVGTGSAVESGGVCACCGLAPGVMYVGPTYGEEDFTGQLCLQCIADGRAHAKLDVAFVDEEAVGGGEWEEVEEGIVEAVAYRTPAFAGWQQERWWTHCGDAAAFLGRVGCRELKMLGPAAAEGLRVASGLEETPEWRHVLKCLDADGSPTGYLFRCLHCGAYGGYWDSD